MTDDRFDDFLRDAAQSYNAPPATPREQLWERIQAARRAESASVRPIVSAPSRLARRSWAPVAAAAAAALLIGVGIGRWSQSPPESVPPAESTASRAAPESSPPPAAPIVEPAAPASPAPLAVIGTPRQERPVMPAAASSPRVATGPAGTEPPAPSDIGEYPAIGTAYRVAAMRHLGQAEALLTSFRTESRAGRLDVQVSAWADDLLSTTRLLLDSPAAADPRMRRLLDDLELVLAQIAQLPVQREERELELIDRSVEQRNMLTRLRTVVPAGLRPSGT